MKLADKFGERLYTKNYRIINSHAALSMDYHVKLKIVEIEYKTSKIYHYLDIDKKVWNKFITFANKGEGLGTYLNQNFKKMIEEYNYDYYELIPYPNRFN